MKLITLDNQPDFAAVIDGRGDLMAAMARACQALHAPENQTVVVVRKSISLTETHKRAAASLCGRSAMAYACLGSDRFMEVGYAGNGLAPKDRMALDSDVGHDFREFIEAVHTHIPALRQMEIRADDFSNSKPHIDFSDNPAGGVTATMAAQGGGTIIAALTRAMLYRARDDETGIMGWRLRPEVKIDAQNGWAVANGDICLMRSREWPETHLPTLHCSPSRRLPGDALERVVGVMLP